MNGFPVVLRIWEDSDIGKEHPTYAVHCATEEALSVAVLAFQEAADLLGRNIVLEEARE